LFFLQVPSPFQMNSPQFPPMDSFFDFSPPQTVSRGRFLFTTRPLSCALLFLVFLVIPPIPTTFLYTATTQFSPCLQNLTRGNLFYPCFGLRSSIHQCFFTRSRIPLLAGESPFFVRFSVPGNGGGFVGTPLLSFSWLTFFSLSVQVPQTAFRWVLCSFFPRFLPPFEENPPILFFFWI